MNKFAWLFVSALLLSNSAWAQEDDEEDEYADIDRALLVVRKSVKEDVIVQGREVTVTIDIFNAGSSTAKNVNIEDRLPEGASLLSGSTETTFGKIAVNSKSSLSYKIVFASGGMGLQMPLASVKYIADDSDEEQVGYSSTQDFYVRTPLQHIIQHALHGGKYLTLGLARTETHWRNFIVTIAIVGGAFGVNYMIKAAGAASTSRKRSKALADLKNE